jgi:zinc/manganese transport system substrate-binding protein
MTLAAALPALADSLAAMDGVDPDLIATNTADYATTLAQLDAEIATSLGPIAPADRVLVTNHEAFGYFAARYGFELIGAVIPSMATGAGGSGPQLEELAELIREHGVPAIFAETTQPTQLADTLAAEVGDVEVVALYTESLGEEGSGAETYVGMMRTNARLIVEALT